MLQAVFEVYHDVLAFVGAEFGQSFDEPAQMAALQAFAALIAEKIDVVAA